MTKLDLLINQDDFLELDHAERKEYLQKIKILKSLYFLRARTKNEICDEFGISSPTTLRLLNHLIENGYVQKKGRDKSPGGTKSELYVLQHAIFYVLGIQLERNKIRIGIFDNNNKKVVEFEDLDFQIEKEASVINYLYSNALNLITKSGLDINRIMGVGISMSPFVSSQEGRNFTDPLEKEKSETIEQALGRKFNKPVYMLNKAKSTGFAQYTFGLARKKKNVILISLDWGIDLAVLLNGKIFPSSSEFIKGFGHIPFVEDGILCSCFKRGCLETVASGTALTRMAWEGLNDGEYSILRQFSQKQSEKLSPQIIIEAANKGDQFAIKILSKIGKNLGKGIAILIHLLNPELIIIDGKFAETKFLIPPIQKSINAFCMPLFREKIEIKLSDLGEDSILLGSVAIVMENFFEKEISRMISVIS